MKEQRWPGDYQTKEEQFRTARDEERQALRDVNSDLTNDYLAYARSDGIDKHQMNELQMSVSNQLDVVGMQPHARECLEYEMNCARSERKFEMIEGQMVDYTPGIQFSGRP